MMGFVRGLGGENLVPHQGLRWHQVRHLLDEVSGEYGARDRTAGVSFSLP